jgi:hypothetical protein
MSLVSRLIAWLRDPRRWDPSYQVPMKEDRFPVDAMGRPDLSYYTEPVAYYQAMFDAYLASFERALSREESNLATRQCVHAQWGLIARGADSIPYALRLLQHSIPEARAAGASTLQEVGGVPEATDTLLRALQVEADDEARTAIVETLAKTGSSAALEALQRLRAETTNDADLLESIDRSIARLRKTVG